MMMKNDKILCLQFRRRLLGMSLRGCLKCNITYCLNFELTSAKVLWAKVAEMRSKGVVFSKMCVLRSMENELVPSPRQKKHETNQSRLLCPAVILPQTGQTVASQ